MRYGIIKIADLANIEQPLWTVSCADYVNSNAYLKMPFYTIEPFGGNFEDHRTTNIGENAFLGLCPQNMILTSRIDKKWELQHFLQ